MKETVDLSRAQPGDKVTITFIYGKALNSMGINPNYITVLDSAVVDFKIEPKPFDWKDLKPGMAFNFYNEICHYVFTRKDKTKLFFFPNCEVLQDIFMTINAGNLLRAPEHDIEVCHG